MCTESTTAIGMRKMAIMDDMMCTVNPMPMRAPMVMITVAIATIMGAVISDQFLKNKNRRIKIMAPAAGAAMAICTNISTPN